MRSRFVSQMYVHGNSMADYLVGLVVLDEDSIKLWSNENKSVAPSIEKNSKLWRAVFDDLIQIGQLQHLMPYEQVKTIAILNEPFTMENDMFTPTFKIRRKAVEKKYKQLLEDLYKNTNV